MKKYTDKWAEKINKHPGKMLIATLLIYTAIGAGATQVGVEDQGTEDFLPDSFPVIQAFETISQEFGQQSTTYKILIETQPTYSNSTEPRDIRNPEILKYIKRIKQESKQTRYVTTVNTPLDQFKTPPTTLSESRRAFKQLGPRTRNTVSEDYRSALIEIKAQGLTTSQEDQLGKQLKYNIEATPQPAGTTITYTGQTFIDQAFQNQSRNTTSTTTTVALILILVVVIALFRSIYYGINALLTLIFGIIAGFGLFGWLGFNLSPATSGAISIGIGIAIDFGIQPISRYKEEIQTHSQKKSLQETITGVFRPMTLGMIAAVLGFSSLIVGRVTFLWSLGVMLSLTTIFAYTAAFTIIPCSLTLHQRHIQKHTHKIKKKIKRNTFK